MVGNTLYEGTRKHLRRHRSEKAGLLRLQRSVKKLISTCVLKSSQVQFRTDGRVRICEKYPEEPGGL